MPAKAVGRVAAPLVWLWTPMEEEEAAVEVAEMVVAGEEVEDALLDDAGDEAVRGQKG